MSIRAAALIVLVVAARDVAGQVVRGRVVDANTGSALAGASLSAVGDPTTARTDDSGKFVLVIRRPGTVVLTARRLGYQAQTWTFAMTAADTADATLPLEPAVARLDTVNVNATAAAASPFVADFERRRAAKNGGTFITRADIDNNPPIQTADLLRRVPQVDVRQKGMPTVVVSRRGPVSVLLTQDMCVMPLGRDGLILGPTYNLNDIPANEIYGIEVYGGPATIPVEFRNSLPNGVCGLVMIWTRRGAAEGRKPFGD
jgi:hypothetical protein